MKKQEFQPREVALETKLALATIYTGIWTEQIKARKIDGKWLVAASEVERLKRERAARQKRAQNPERRRKRAIPEVKMNLLDPQAETMPQSGERHA